MKEAEKEKLWQDYIVKPTPDKREKLIIEYAQLVKVVAGRLCVYLGNTVEYEDLCSYGIFGLIDAIDKFDSCKDVKFETYASLRIRGSILDQIRKMDWIPRSVRKKQRQLDDAMKAFESREGRPATDEELCQELGITGKELIGWQTELNVTNVVSLDEFVEAGADPVMSAEGNSHFMEPEAALEKEELKQKLEEAIAALTEREKQVILLCYYEDMSLKEISATLDVSESRVSQLHTKAIGKMKKIMGDYMGLLTV